MHTDTLERRFMEKVSPEPNTGCWLWLGFVTRGGYGQIRRTSDSKTPAASAHIVAWELANGRRVPPGLFVCHRCDVRCCVNPAHLFLGTHQDNMDDMWKKGRANVPFGSKTHAAKLTECAVAEMRALRAAGGACVKELAERYGVKEVTVYQVLSGRTWKRVTASPERSGHAS